MIIFILFFEFIFDIKKHQKLILNNKKMIFSKSLSGRHSRAKNLTSKAKKSISIKNKVNINFTKQLTEVFLINR